MPYYSLLIGIHRGDFVAGAEHVAKAMDLEPDNEHYRNNHEKMIHRAAH